MSGMKTKCARLASSFGTAPWLIFLSSTNSAQLATSLHIRAFHLKGMCLRLRAADSLHVWSLAYDQQFSSKLPNDTFLVSGAKHYNIFLKYLKKH
jgi:hypothetical protein